MKVVLTLLSTALLFVVGVLTSPGSSIAGQAAIAEVVERYWSGAKPRKAKSYADGLRAAGA
jgi:hypothetical protein